MQKLNGKNWGGQDTPLHGVSAGSASLLKDMHILRLLFVLCVAMTVQGKSFSRKQILQLAGLQKNKSNSIIFEDQKEIVITLSAAQQKMELVKLKNFQAA